MQQFNKGDKVWFINKYKKRVTGSYLEIDTIETAKGPLPVHIVVSDDAFFGPNCPKAVHCAVSDGRLHKENV